jgi:predicted nucleotidyltransferase
MGDLKGKIFYGTEGFIKQLRGLLGEKGNIKEVTRLQRYVARSPLRELLKGEGKKAKDKTIYNAYVRYGYSMKEISDHLTRK